MRKIKKRLAAPETILWQWSQNKEGKHPVKLRISYHGKREYYPLEFQGEKLFLSPEEWADIRRMTY